MPEDNIDVPTLISFLQEALGQQAVEIAVLKTRLAQANTPVGMDPSSVDKARQE